MDEELRQSLGEDGVRVYEDIARMLSDGNEAVQNAADVGAAILASHARAWSERETAAGRETSAEDYMQSVEVVADAGSTERDDLDETVRRWNRLIDEYDAADKQEWRQNRDQEHIPVMKVPLVLQMLDVPFEDIKIFGSFFAHSVNRQTHPSMTLDVLRQIPQQITDPLMVIRGNRPDTYVFVIEVRDASGATVVVPLEMNKEILGQLSGENFITSAFGKTRGLNRDQPSYSWFKTRIEAGDVLYCNKNKSLEYFRSCEGLFPVASEFTEALSRFIVSEDFRNVKTEEDLARIKQEFPTRYQTEWHGSLHAFDNFSLNHIGEGDGGMAHGWGLYFSETRRTAEYYSRENSPHRIVTIGDRHIEYISPSNQIDLDTGQRLTPESGLALAADRLAYRKGDYARVMADLAENIQMVEEAAKQSGKETFPLLDGFRATYEVLKDHPDAAYEEKYRHGHMYQVDIPGRDELLDEETPLEEQSELVKDAIEQIKEEDEWESIDEYAENGLDLYDAIVGRYEEDGSSDPHQDASMLLSSYGIKGISYDGGAELCYVIFDDTAIEILQREQRRNAVLQGRTDFLAGGRRLIELFEGADETTFLHETAHVLYDDLCRGSAVDAVIRADKKTVDDWAEWDENQREEYRGTPWEQEFFERERRIRLAIADGDKVQEAALRAEWREERFARGFERYLAEGKAPTSALGKVFAKCKRLFQNAYHAFQGDGGKPSPAVADVMDRMLDADTDRERVQQKEEEKTMPEEQAAKTLVPAEKGRRKRKPKADAYQKMTDDFLAMIKGDKLPWSSGWDASYFAHYPFNGDSKKVYNRANGLTLSFVMMSKGSTDPRFFTYASMDRTTEKYREKVEKWKKEGKKYDPQFEYQYRIKKGAKSATIWTSFKIDHDKAGNPLPVDEQYWAQTPVNLFHASDCIRREYHKDKDGNPILDKDGQPTYTDHPLKEYKPEPKTISQEETNKLCEAILKASGAKISYDVPNQILESPCYVPGRDEIHLPDRGAFQDQPTFYAVALHELCHWTGHKDRLDRDLEGYGKGSESYAKEELRAELASTFLSFDLGIPMNPTNHAAYLQSWIKNLEEDKKELYNAAQDARKIANYVKKFIPVAILDKTQDEDKALVETTETVQEVPTKEEEKGNILDEQRAIPTDDAAIAELPPEAVAKGTGKYFRYLCDHRPPGPGNIPAENLAFFDESEKDAAYGAAYYTKQLSAKTAAQYQLKPDYRYFANKTLSVRIHRQNEGVDTKLRRLNADYTISMEKSFIRTPYIRENTLDAIADYMEQRQEPLRPGDLVEFDGHIYKTEDVGFTKQDVEAKENTREFTEQKPNRLADDFILTPIKTENVERMISEAKAALGEETYAAYVDKLHENIERADAINALLSESEEGNTLSDSRSFSLPDRDDPAYRADLIYADCLRQNLFANGLSSYTPMDERGWKKLDIEFARRKLVAEGKHYDGTAIAETIQRNSPRAIASKDPQYGLKLVLEEVKRHEKAVETLNASRNTSKAEEPAERPRPAARVR